MDKNPTSLNFSHQYPTYIGYWWLSHGQVRVMTTTRPSWWTRFWFPFSLAWSGSVIDIWKSSAKTKYSSMKNKYGTGYEIVDNHDGTYTLLELHGDKTYVVVANVSLDEVLETKKELESDANHTDFKTYFKNFSSDSK